MLASGIKIFVAIRLIKHFAGALVLMGALLYAPLGFAEAPRGELELGALREEVTNNFGDWSGIFARGSARVGDRDILSGEFLRQRRFQGDGYYLALGNTHVWNPHYYTVASLGVGTGDLIFPELQADATLNRLWLNNHFITNLGLTHLKVGEISVDRLLLGASYIVNNPSWIVQGGVYLSRSHPGNLDFRSQFLSLTQGREGERQLSLTVSWGSEAYQLTGDTPLRVDFDSTTARLSWKQWVEKEWGFKATLEHYDNPFYDRNGVELSVFRRF